MSIDEMMYITLQYLGNQGAIRLLADKFNRTESTVWRAVKEITHCFFEHQSKFIVWPKPEELSSFEEKFKDRAGFPGTIGAIDGCHIKIHPPIGNQMAYRNYKKFHSIVLMAIVLPDRRLYL